MKLSHLCALVACLPGLVFAAADVMLDEELNGLDIRTWVIESEKAADALTPDNYKRLRLTNNHDSAVTCTLEPEPAEDSWTFFPEATLSPGEEAELRIGGNYESDIIRAKLVCEDTELL